MRLSPYEANGFTSIDCSQEQKGLMCLQVSFKPEMEPEHIATRKPTQS